MSLRRLGRMGDWVEDFACHKLKNRDYIADQHIPKEKILILFLLRCIMQECGNFTWRLSDCEEIRRGNLLPGRGRKGLKDL